jgi:hypothetical protein
MDKELLFGTKKLPPCTQDEWDKKEDIEYEASTR